MFLKRRQTNSSFRDAVDAGKVGRAGDVDLTETACQTISAAASLKLWLDEISGASVWIFRFGLVDDGEQCESRPLPISNRVSAARLIGGPKDAFGTCRP
ncbi:MAG TPA: hypothetical protein DD670_06515 [Planctomycetaceae bacterium]|nr:hypothetical protein [Planctomycetaceae bacterium]